MDEKFQPRPSSPGKDVSRKGWRKAYAELLAVGRVVRLYPTSTLLWPFLLLSLIMVVGVWGITHVARSEERSTQERAAILALDAAMWVKQTIDNAIAPVMLTAAMVHYNPRLSAVKSLFDGMVRAMLTQAPPQSIRVLQLVPHGVVNGSYPVAGNEGSLGLDVFASATNREGAIRTAADRKLTLVGPINFVQGGRGIIVRDPIFIANVSAQEDFDIPWPINAACGPPCAYNATTRTALWGFIAVLVNIEVFTQSNRSKLLLLEDLGYYYELRALNGNGLPEQIVAASAKPPRDPVEVPISLPNNEWVIRVSPEHGWSSKWYGGLLAGVVVLAVATSVMLFAVLVTWRRHQMLLEALLPKEILQDLVNEDPASPLYMCPKIRQADTPADVLLNMMGDLLEGYPPRLPDVVFIRTALLRNLDLYTPLDVRSQIKAAELDSEVAQALMQQLVGGRRTSLSSWRQMANTGGGGGAGSGGGGAGSGGGGAVNGDAHRAADADGEFQGAANLASLSYDFDTLSGALAFVLSPEAAHRDNTGASTCGAAAAPAAAAGGAEKRVMPYNAACFLAGVGSTLSHGNSCPLLVRGAPLMSGNSCLASTLADVVTAPPADSSCIDDTAGGGGGGSGEGEDYVGAVGAAAAAANAIATPDGADTAAPPLGGAPLARRALPGSHLPARLTSCARSNPGSSALLLRSSAGCDDATRATLQPHSPPQGQSLLPTWTLHGSHPRRPSLMIPAPGASNTSGAAGAVGVCATCGGLLPAAAQVEGLPASLGMQAPAAVGPGGGGHGWASSSVTGSSATMLMAVARRLRVGGGGGGAGGGGGGGGHCAAAAATSVGVLVGASNVGSPTDRLVPSFNSVSQSGVASSGGVGVSVGGVAKPNSRLALVLSPRNDRALSQPAPSFPLLQPASPRGLCSFAGASAAATAGAVSAVAAAATVMAAPAAGAAPSAFPGPFTRGDYTEDTRFGRDASLVAAGAAPATAPVVVVMATGAFEEAATAAAAAAAQTVGRPPAPLLQEVERLLAGTDAWHFDAWALRNASGGHALSALGFYLVKRQGLMARFQIKPVALARLLRQLEAGYNDNPYHNATHAADVLQTLHVLLHSAQLTVHYLDPLGLLAAYFAAIIHDLGHPGLTGDFLIATSAPLALRYNDRSPLENHHCAAAFELLHRYPELDITAAMSQSEKAAFRKQVIELVLATDMKQHFSTLSHFNTVHRLAAFSHSQHQHMQQPHSHKEQQQHPQTGTGGEAVAAGGGSATANGGGGGAAGAGSALPPTVPSGTVRGLSSNSRTAHQPAAGAPAVAASATGNGHGNANGTASATASHELVVVVVEPPASVSGNARPPPQPLDDTERLLSLQLVLKCADIGNLGRELECYKRWVDVLEEEFFRQGDRERELGLSISPLSDRTKQGVSKSQIGFFDFVALPLVHATAAAFPGAQPLLRAFLSNYHYWKRGEMAASHDSVTSGSQQQQQPAVTQLQSSKQSSPHLSARHSLSLSGPNPPPQPPQQTQAPSQQQQQQQ